LDQEPGFFIGEAMQRKNIASKYKLLSDLMDYVPDVIYFKDKKGRFVMVNQAHARGLGLKPEQLVGKTDFDLFPKKRAERMAKDDLWVMRTGKPIIDKIERATRPDGIDNYVSTTKIPRFDSRGRVTGIMGITRDITHRMQFEHLKEKRILIEKKLEALEELNKIKSEFVSAVSHELRTPLAIVKQLLTLIFKEAVGPLNDKQKEVMVKVTNNVERLKNIIDELLDISRIEGKRLKLHYSLVNLNDLIKESEDFFKKLAAEKNIGLTYHLPKEEINIFIDPERIVQVISNLVNNAIKFTEESGKIKVEVRVLEDKVRIGVIDTGIGIAKPDLPKLFGKFVQVSHLASAERKGVGLGLSIIKELVEKHGGEVWAESELGVGSKFYFTLPLYYTARILGKTVRDKINHLLNQGISVYLINFLIVNFDDFKKKITVEARHLSEGLKTIIEATFKEVFGAGKQKSPIVLADMEKGKCSIILPKVTDKNAAAFCELLKDKAKDYFTKNKIEEVFIAVGIFSYPSDSEAHTDKGRSNLNMKEIYIGMEMRRHKRINYQTRIEVRLPDNTTDAGETVDISASGICYTGNKPLKTDTKVEASFELLRKKEPVLVTARVNWIKEIPRLPEEKSNKYKIGLEFTMLKDRDRKNLDRELRLYYE
jgi:PAS domain S-box-containing protein